MITGRRMEMRCKEGVMKGTDGEELQERQRKEGPTRKRRLRKEREKTERKMKKNC